MNILKKSRRRKMKLYLRVPDSGKTWAIQYDDIQKYLEIISVTGIY